MDPQKVLNFFCRGVSNLICLGFATPNPERVEGPLKIDSAQVQDGSGLTGAESHRLSLGADEPRPADRDPLDFPGGAELSPGASET